MGFHLGLGNYKPFQISSTFLNIQIDFSSAVVWMDLIIPLNFSSPNLLSYFFGTVPMSLTMIFITVTNVF